MNKYLSSLSVIFLLSMSSAYAADLWQYNPTEGCSLRKAANGSWKVVQADEVGQNSFTLQTSKANAAFSNFKFKGAWYAAKTECFKISDQPATAPEEASAASGGSFQLKGGNWFVEPKLTLYMMSGSGTGGGEVGGITFEKYQPALGLALKVGLYGSEHSAWFLEYSKFSGKRNATTELVEDSMTSFNLGYQYYFAMKGAWKPYLAGALGYNKLSQTLTTTTAVKYSGSGIGFVLEGGTLYELSHSFALSGGLNYTIASVGTLTEEGATTEITNTISYTRIGINLGVRYNF